MKGVVYRLSRAAGLFRLSRLAMRKRLLVLCYHGFELQDEARFRSALFMRSATFERRMSAIRRSGFPVLPLTEAVYRLREDSLPNNSICITIDDGFFSVLDQAVPVLRKYDLPATVYATTYYLEKRTPIFRLVVQYMVWRAAVEAVDISDIIGAGKPISFEDGLAADRAMWAIIEYGEKECKEEQRQEICRLLGERLGVSYERIVESRILSLMTPEELCTLGRYGIDVQLHTHRHGLPLDDEGAVRREIVENRRILQAHMGYRSDHFCYPSGIWDRRQWPWLESEGIASAATCDPGLNTATTALLALYRFLDDERLPQLTFEAELFGFVEIVRIAAGRRRKSDAIRAPVRVSPSAAGEG